MANSKDKQKSVAKHLYMKGTPTAQIVELTGVSRQSVSRWLNTEGWKEERAAREMSKESITSKTLSKLGDAIDKADGDERSIGRMADSLLKSVKISRTGQGRRCRATRKCRNVWNVSITICSTTLCL